MEKVTFRIAKSDKSIIAVLHKMQDNKYLCFDYTTQSFIECGKEYLSNHTTSAMHYNIAQLCDELYRCINVLEYKIVDDIW